jgi:serine/threonine protein kinase
MGEVYRARDTQLGRDVAIKVLAASFAADADRLKRFEQEARTAGALNHPNLVAVLELGVTDPRQAQGRGRPISSWSWSGARRCVSDSHL